MSERYWAVVPAAGVGKRMGSDIPKQYLDLMGRCVIDHTIDRLLSHRLIDTVYVSLSEVDGYWGQTERAGDPRVVRVKGGDERCHSVLNALHVIGGSAHADDWVLVHDAARPCLTESDLDRLIDNLRDHPVGGLLGVPVQDTLKRVSTEGEVVTTVPRHELWQAYTPQMFRLGMLTNALEQAIDRGELVTDDASAMELAGHHPSIVEGHAGNIKITRPVDLSLAAYYLSQDRA
ncbi:MAG: 2-C-methyl-D-erythritol 4-phosphate cytidylyltransferase [Candidatus Thiodiazotropha sp. (ex Monitilora ramsayi)]|nr:2-C-methyl-D-erythritol 4-phosphate cytidylyltransferase [Candidatus Thiodiazotropha sp. (ex Monitilora ramsayi)]